MIIWGAVPELTQPQGPAFRIPRIGRESRIGWLVSDAFWRNLELIPSD